MTDRATNEPREARAGMTWEWERSCLVDPVTGASYPAGTWTLTYWFKRMGGTDKFSIVASADGEKHVVDVVPATTAAYVADDYTWAAVVADGTDKHQVDHGTMKILPRYDQDAALDDRTHAKKMLEAVEAALETFSTNATVKSYSIGSRQWTRAELPDLMALRDKYKAEIYRATLAENARNGMEGGKLVVRF